VGYTPQQWQGAVETKRQMSVRYWPLRRLFNWGGVAAAPVRMAGRLRGSGADEGNAEGLLAAKVQMAASLAGSVVTLARAGRSAVVNAEWCNAVWQTCWREAAVCRSGAHAQQSCHAVPRPSGGAWSHSTGVTVCETVVAPLRPACASVRPGKLTQYTSSVSPPSSAAVSVGSVAGYGAAIISGRAGALQAYSSTTTGMA
jgi:hypothetical protein